MTASNSHGENGTCTAKPRTVRATMAMRTRTRIASMPIDLHYCRSGCADVLRLPPPVARVDRDQPRFDPEMRAASHDVPPRRGSGQLADACRSRVLVSSSLQGGTGPAREGDRPTQVRRRGADNRSAAQRVIQGRAGIVWVAVRPGG